eukprot:1924141-Rhodomonas_salina.1
MERRCVLERPTKALADVNWGSLQALGGERMLDLTKVRCLIVLSRLRFDRGHAHAGFDRGHRGTEAVVDNECMEFDRSHMQSFDHSHVQCDVMIVMRCGVWGGGIAFDHCSMQSFDHSRPQCDAMRGIEAGYVEGARRLTTVICNHLTTVMAGRGGSSCAPTLTS